MKYTTTNTTTQVSDVGTKRITTTKLVVPERLLGLSCLCEVYIGPGCPIKFLTQINWLTYCSPLCTAFYTQFSFSILSGSESATAIRFVHTASIELYIRRWNSGSLHRNDDDSDGYKFLKFHPLHTLIPPQV